MTVVLILGLTPLSAMAAISQDAQSCVDLKVLKGTEDGVTSEYLADNCQRYQAVVIMARLMGLESGIDNMSEVAPNFSDTAGHSAYVIKVMAFAKANPELGFIGYEDGTFHPEEKITAQQINKVLLVVLGYTQGKDFTWDQVPTKAREAGLTSLRNSTTITNDNLATVLLEALKAKTATGTQTLADKLVAKNLIDKTVATKLGLTTVATTTTAAITSSGGGGGGGGGSTAVSVASVSIIGEDTVTVTLSNPKKEYVAADFTVKVGTGANLPSTDFTVATTTANTAYTITLIGNVVAHGETVTVTVGASSKTSSAADFTAEFLAWATTPITYDSTGMYTFMQINYDRKVAVASSKLTITMKTPASSGTATADQNPATGTLLWSGVVTPAGINSDAYFQYGFRNGSSVGGDVWSMSDLGARADIEQNNDYQLQAGAVITIKIEVVAGGVTYFITRDYTVTADDVAESAIYDAIEQATALASINAATTAPEMQTELQTNGIAAGLSLIDYKTLSDAGKLAVATTVCGAGSNSYTTATLATAFNNAVTTRKAVEAADADIAAAIALIPNTLSPVQGTDTNLITMLNELTGMNALGVTITLTSSANAQVAQADGAISYGTAITDDVTVQVAKGTGTSQTMVVSVVVPAFIVTPPTGTAKLITNSAEATAADLTGGDWNWTGQAITGAHWMIFDYTVGNAPITVTGFKVSNGSAEYTSGTLNLSKAAGDAGRVGIEAADIDGAAAGATAFPAGTYTITINYTLDGTPQTLVSENVVVSSTPVGELTVTTVDGLKSALADLTIDTIIIDGAIGTAGDINCIFTVGRAVTIKGNGSSSSEVRGSFIVKTDENVSFEDLKITNKHNYDGAEATKCAINFYGKNITISGCTIQSLQPDTPDQISNGVVIYPSDASVTFDITDNEFVGYGLSDGATAILVVENYTMATKSAVFGDLNTTSATITSLGSMDSDIATNNNNFTSCDRKYVRTRGSDGGFLIQYPAE